MQKFLYIIIILLLPASYYAYSHESSKEFIIKLNHGNDDVEERKNGSINIDSGDIELVDDASHNQIVGLRYQLSLTKNDVIEDARIQFTVDEISKGNSKLSIYIENTVNAKPFNLQKNTLTKTKVSPQVIHWQPEQWANINDTTDAQLSTNIASLINQQLSKKGWKPCQHIKFIIKGKGTRTAFAYEANKKYAAKLQIKYKGPKKPITCKSEKYKKLKHKSKPTVHKIGPIPKSTLVNPKTTRITKQAGQAITIHWQKPLHDESGKSLKTKDIAAYKIYTGNEPGQYNKHTTVIPAKKTQHTYPSLTVGYHYFSISVVNDKGTESVLSNSVSVQIVKE